MAEHAGIRFRIGDLFPADDPIARGMTVCAMGLNRAARELGATAAWGSSARFTSKAGERIKSATGITSVPCSPATSAGRSPGQRGRTRRRSGSASREGENRSTARSREESSADPRAMPSVVPRSTRSVGRRIPGKAEAGTDAQPSPGASPVPAPVGVLGRLLPQSPGPIEELVVCASSVCPMEHVAIGGSPA
jgi:hypothetical protein